MKGIKSSRKSLLYLGVILVIALLVFVGVLYYFFHQNTQTKTQGTQSTETQITPESISRSLSVPSTNPEKISDSKKAEILNSLSVPSKTGGQKTISQEDILKNLSAPIK